MCGVCKGSPVDMQDLRTPGQQALDPLVAGAMREGMTEGATKYGGRLSQEPVDPIIQALQMMYRQGGLGGYGGEQGGFPGGTNYAGLPPSGINPSPFAWNPGPPDNGQTLDGPNRTPTRGGPDLYDPQNPYDPQFPPPYNPRDPYNMKDGRPIPR